MWTESASKSFLWTESDPSRDLWTESASKSFLWTESDLSRDLWTESALEHLQRPQEVAGEHFVHVAENADICWTHARRPPQAQYMLPLDILPDQTQVGTAGIRLLKVIVGNKLVSDTCTTVGRHRVSTEICGLIAF